MSGGHVIKIGKGARIKNGRIELRPIYRDASAVIRAKSPKKITVKRKTV